MDNVSSLNVLVAFSFGLLSFFSPCILPLLPGYLSLIAGTNTGDLAANLDGRLQKRALFNSLGFVLGFGLLFVAMGAAASGLGKWLSQYQTVLIRISGVLIIIFGLHVSELLPLKVLMRHHQWRSTQKFSGWPGAFLLGLSFAAGWTPCVGPVLASILVLAGSSATLSQGIWLLVLYAAGLAVPFLLAAWGIDSLHRWMAKFNKIIPYVNAISGGLLIAMGILILFGWWNKLVLFFY